MELNLLKEKFKSLFGTEGTMYTSPGRINLIGEHTDYNGGFVLPGAIDKAMYCVIKPNGTPDRIKAYAMDLSEMDEFGLDDIPIKQWGKYIFGVCHEIMKLGKQVQGFDCVFAGDVPLGAGMSSSAALESCFGFAINDMYNLGLDRFQLAKIGQATEHNYVGVKCGIMDQFASCFGKAGSLIRLDCRSLEYKYIPFNPEGYRLVLLNTCVAHELASSAYNKRRESCENAASYIRKYHPEVELLRDATIDMLKEVANEVSAEDYMRAEFVIEEIERMVKLVMLWKEVITKP
jgi:galactokinase (EC 2.7.1.6)